MWASGHAARSPGEPGAADDSIPGSLWLKTWRQVASYAEMPQVSGAGTTGIIPAASPESSPLTTMDRLTTMPSRPTTCHALRWLRLWPSLLLLALALAGRCEDAPAGDTPSPEPPAGRAVVIYPPFTLIADTISYDALANQVTAQGQAEVHSPKGDFYADVIKYDLTKQTGYLERAHGTAAKVFYFHADALTVDQQGTQHLQNSGVTACAKPHPDFEIRARDMVISPDHRYVARRMSLYFGGRRLITIPRLRGQLGPTEEEQNHIPLLVGLSDFDGVYLGTRYAYPLTRDTDLVLLGRIGTSRQVRGELALMRPIAIPHFNGGVLSLRLTTKDDGQNRTLVRDPNEDLRLKQLTVSRVPVLELNMHPIKLGGKWNGSQVKMGFGAGRYLEDPTGVTHNRARVWATLDSPSARLGDLRLSGGLGLEGATYGKGQNRTVVGGLLTLESRPNAKEYFSISLLHRNEHGTTPFLFDRTLATNELRTTVEVPISRGDRWRLGWGHHFDLDTQQTLDYSFTLVYKQDCLSYGLTYDAVDHSFGLGLALNALGGLSRNKPRLIGQ